MAVAHLRRRLSAGSELQSDGTAHARVWAPACRRIESVIEPRGTGGRRTIPLECERDGFFSGLIPDVRPGDLYWYRLDGERLRPDPASRFQPDGPHGPSAFVDPLRFEWTDGDWHGVAREGQVLYEMHVGTFTPEGTWAAAAAQLRDLADTGITVIEMMPVADFAGRFGWGYDGVNLYAPTRLYGTPDDLRALVDRAHALGLGVVLDVVYNHFGPDGNYIGEFSPDYFTDRYNNDWGKPLNFEGPRPVRDFFIENAGYWIDEFHFDGLRLDATQDIHDASPVHIIAEIVERARAAAGRRQVYIIAENEPQETRIVRARREGGYGADALWNDDYHHAAVAALTGRREAYYRDYRGTPQELISCAKYGYLYQGQWYSWQKKPRGRPGLDLPRSSFVAYLENHDQLANTAFGRRLHQLVSRGRLRALTALTLLGPATPLLFQGQEFASSAPFLYFADHREELREPVRSGRQEFLAQFPSITDPEVLAALPSPVDEATYRRCKLDPAERRRHVEARALHRDLLEIRRDDPVVAGAATQRIDGAVLSAHAFVLRYFGWGEGDRLLIINLACDLDLTPVPEPLVAPPPDSRWTIQWSSEAVRYGGHGTPPLRQDAGWVVPGEAAILLRSEPLERDRGRQA
jgi:maltooligosyltrehalose trehalohydrolase